MKYIIEVMKKNRLALMLVSAICAFSGCTSGGSKKESSNSSTSQGPKVDPRNIPYEEVYPDYDQHYSSYDFQTMYGEDLMSELHRYFILEHKTYVKYENIRYYENTAWS